MSNKPTPIRAIEMRMLQNGWTQKRLSRLTGYPQVRISEYMNYKRRFPLNFIRAYHEIDPELPLEILIQPYSLSSDQ